ncbi:MAG: type II secretion system F family protein [Rhodopila sp.]|nr:type II secretion system F family protein [Rhodopila sp.]
MSMALIGPMSVLTAVLVACPVILIADSRKRKLLRQIELVTALTGQDALLQQARSIRRAKIRFQRLWEVVRSLFHYDPEFSEAYSLPVPLVLAAAMIVGCAAAFLAYTTLSFPISVLSGVLTTGMVLRGLFGWQYNRYTGSLRRQLPDALQFVVGALRAGFPVMEAFRGITREAPEPTRGQFVQVLNEISLGRPVQEALLNLYHRTRVTEYAIFAVTLAVQTKSGGHLAETVQTLAETVRERITIAARAKALAGEGTVSATILSILPVVTGILLTLIRPGYLDPMFIDPRGKRLFMMGVASLLAGIWMMRRMIAGVVRE